MLFVNINGIFITKYTCTNAYGTVKFSTKVPVIMDTKIPKNGARDRYIIGNVYQAKFIQRESVLTILTLVRLPYNRSYWFEASNNFPLWSCCATELSRSASSPKSIPRYLRPTDRDYGVFRDCRALLRHRQSIRETYTYQYGMQIDPVHFQPFHLVQIIQLCRGG